MDVVIASLIYRVRSFPRHHKARVAWRKESAALLDTAAGCARAEL